jgi:peptidoglycan/LPS O-acetylase OafA/YrhL
MEAGKQGSANNHLAVLDVLRGLAILMVYFYHCLQWSHGSTHFPWKGYFRDFSQPLEFILISPLTWGGYGVAVFFVISGFCIHLSFARSRSSGFGEFFYKRFWRIVPPFLVALGVFLVGDILTGQIKSNSEALWQFGTHALLVHNFWQDTYYGVNPSFWSIAVEAQLYAIYPLLWICSQKIGWNKALAVTLIVELGIRSWSAFARLDIPPPPPKSSRPALSATGFHGRLAQQSLKHG